jgi:hypothetical protein
VCVNKSAHIFMYSYVSTIYTIHYVRCTLCTHTHTTLHCTAQLKKLFGQGKTQEKGFLMRWMGMFDEVAWKL